MVAMIVLRCPESQKRCCEELRYSRITRWNNSSLKGEEGFENRHKNASVSIGK